MATTIPPLDAMFFLSESPESPKHVGVLQIYELPPRAPRDYLARLAARMKAELPTFPFDSFPVFPRAGMPQWQRDERIDMDYHLRRSTLPAPGDDAQLLETVARLHAAMFDRQRPCWFCQVIEGLEGNRFAVYAKIHHAYIDGMSGVRRLYGALSASPRGRAFTAPWACPELPRARRRAEPDLAARLEGLRRAALTQAGALAEVSGTLGRMGLQWLKLRESFNQVPFAAPRTLTNGPLKRNSRSIGVCTLPLGRVKAAGAALGGKVNDVVLAVVDAALHDYLAGRGEPVEEALVALCPMSLREEGDTRANTQASALHVRLGAPQAAMRERLAQVIASTSKSKAEARELSRAALQDYTLVMFGLYELLERSGLQQRVPASYNVLVSNVPGPQGGALYMMGSRLLASYPISTFLPGTNLNVTVLSHGDSIDFGMLADRQAMPDVSRLAEAIVRRFAELEHALAKPRRRRAPRR